MILNNLFVATLRKKGTGKYVATGDGTGYSLTVSKHNRSMKGKQEETVKRKQFVYSFALMELNARMYIGHEVSMRSEKDAYMKAIDMISELKNYLDSIRLYRYYSGQFILDDFTENTRIFIIPKKNSRIRGKKGCGEITRRFMNDPIAYLR